MKLIEALGMLRGMARRTGDALRCFIAAGINPLHLKTFMTAELSLFTDRPVELSEGVFGDLAGNIARLAKSDAVIGLAVIEWADLDPRLGIRSSARWIVDEVADILLTAEARALQLQMAIEEIPAHVTVAISLPTLPLPPFSFGPGWQAGSLELGLRAMAASFGSRIASRTNVRILSQQWLDRVSPQTDRFNAESELLTGFPYGLAHASALAGGLARLTQRQAPKRGLITDLDNTLWNGVLGEDGLNGISWDIEHRAQMHGFYQRFLGALASEGVFVGVASKNDPVLVEEALARPDLALSETMLFPVKANWGPKSESVTHILRAWNVGADSVVFIDDSALELEEVKALHPGIECLQFPKKEDAASVYDLTLRLRDLFGKSTIQEEDSIRVNSVRASHFEFEHAGKAASGSRELLERVGAEISFNFEKTPLDHRVLELVNKTNQFNLNGRRHTETSWMNYLREPATVLLAASYRDKFGPLGKVAVLAGTLRGSRLTIDTWVMSCRAFSRRIEHGCLVALFNRFNLDEVECLFLRTDRNGPLQEFLSEVTEPGPTESCIIRREAIGSFPEVRFSAQEVING
jgi:FkbH-like protein